MAIVELVMPKLGESIMEATILKWLKNPGDAVALDETVLEIATDKVDSEVPSTAAGIIDEILYSVNDIVPIGAVIARIRTEAASTTAPPPAISPTVQTVKAEPAKEITSPVNHQETKPITIGSSRFYSPLVLNIAASEGISMSELENLPGTGNEGRVTKKDILHYVSTRKQPSSQPSKEMIVSVQKIQPETQSNHSLPVSYTGNVEIVEMDRMRKLIA
ncbi:MAG: 2-oxo acid dehydrogenase subunit E2, partial [Chitinophagaceae bacterium]|nr:2-oxo acid dehydrogenase subunit E2 [Chitinophagaceae bacterium]